MFPTGADLTSYTRYLHINFMQMAHCANIIIYIQISICVGTIIYYIIISRYQLFYGPFFSFPSTVRHCVWFIPRSYSRVITDVISTYCEISKTYLVLEWEGASGKGKYFMIFFFSYFLHNVYLNNYNIKVVTRFSVGYIIRYSIVGATMS